MNVEEALREAKRRDLPPEEELLRYVIHGILHLAGEEDDSPQGRHRMRRLEREAIRRAVR